MPEIQIDTAAVRITRLAEMGKIMRRMIIRDCPESQEKEIAINRLTDTVAMATGCIHLQMLDEKPVQESCPA